ncbi:MAG: phosphatidate cytidylyltransferase [Solirubrobacterales bacterium]
MLKYRLIFGSLMTVLFSSLVLLDGWLDGSLTVSPADDRQVQATILAILVAGIISLGGLELARLAAAKGLVILNPACVIGLVLLTTTWYWPRLVSVPQGVYLPVVIALTLAGMVVLQHLRFGVSGVLANCGISCFALLYLGLLGSFVLAIRIDAGLWQFLAFMFAVKASDIGAYTSGRLFGRHKLAPRVSPGKTWEGLAGAAVFAVLVSLAFASIFGIMGVWLAPVFGAVMAVVGQLSDLVESMLKRDAQQKDSSNRVPGFGGILDVIDSPLFAAPCAYLFFMVVA